MDGENGKISKENENKRTEKKLVSVDAFRCLSIPKNNSPSFSASPEHLNLLAEN